MPEPELSPEERSALTSYAEVTARCVHRLADRGAILQALGLDEVAFARLESQCLGLLARSGARDLYAQTLCTLRQRLRDPRMDTADPDDFMETLARPASAARRQKPDAAGTPKDDG